MPVALPRTEQIFGTASLAALNVARKFDRKDIKQQLALPGFVERTVSVAERLKPPPAVEAYDAALAGKIDALDTMTDLIHDADGTERPRGIALADLPAPGFKRTDSDDKSPFSIGDVLADRGAAEPRFTDADAVGPAKHEADDFRAAVATIENTIALFRLIEGRVALYDGLVADARGVRAALMQAARDMLKATKFRAASPKAPPKSAAKRSGYLFATAIAAQRAGLSERRLIAAQLDDALAGMDAEFDRLHAREGRPSIAPERLLRASLVQILFSVRSERQLMEQMQYNLLFRWFVGLGIDDPVWGEVRPEISPVG